MLKIRFHPIKRVSMYITDPWYENPLDVEIADLYVVDKTCNYRLPDWSAGRDYSKRLLNDLSESNSKGSGWFNLVDKISLLENQIHKDNKQDP